MPYQILLVDDDEEFREEMSSCLEGYKVIEASSGQQALEMIKRPNAIDLVILDVIIPGLRGTEVLKQMRKIRPDLPIIILTGQSSKEIAIESLKGHADDYIEKPFEVQKFLSTIRRILDSKNLALMAHINKMDRVKMFIERNFDKKINLKDVTEEVHLSAKYLSRLFKKSTGLGFNEYRLKIKMHKAQHLLKTTDQTIEQLANQLGYKNPESFIRIFEKLVRCTPTEYRLKYRSAKNRKL